MVLDLGLLTPTDSEWDCRQAQQSQRVLLHRHLRPGRSVRSLQQHVLLQHQDPHRAVIHEPGPRNSPIMKDLVNHRPPELLFRTK
jgi:hypothetical protein